MCKTSDYGAPCDRYCSNECDGPCPGCEFCPQSPDNVVPSPETATFRGVEVTVTDPVEAATPARPPGPKPLNGRRVSATGGEKGEKPARLGGADPLALEQLALVYGNGEQKYARFNYLKGYDWSLCIDALYRHFLAFQRGEDTDPESGLPHMAHVAWHALALVSFSQRGIGTDDRAPR